MKRKIVLSVVLLILATGWAAAQETAESPPAPPAPAPAVAPAPPEAPAPAPAPEPPAPPADALFSMRGNLFPPELVMRNQKAIGLTPDQKDAIRDAIRDAERKFLDLKWEVQDASESLRENVEDDRVDEARALALLGKVLEVETEIKRTRFILMIRIKNLLTPDQQAKLRDLRLHDVHEVPPVPEHPGSY